MGMSGWLSFWDSWAGSEEGKMSRVEERCIKPEVSRVFICGES